MSIEQLGALNFDPGLAADTPRFCYRVRPRGERWEVDFGGSSGPFVYDTRSEAVQIAKGAARLHWDTRSEPSGVTEEDDDGHVRSIATYGP